MQINNIKTGEVIKLKIDNNITYLTYGTDADIINSSANQTVLDGLITEAYNELNVKLGIDFELVDSKVNWVIKKGSTGNSTTIRVTLPSILLGEILYSGNSLDQLVQSMQPVSSFAVKVKGKSIQYLEELLSPAKEILFSYLEQGIKIEKLITDINGNQSIIEITDINNL